MITRAQYMNDPRVAQGREAAFAAHREYYAQFVGPQTIQQVVSVIGVEALRASTDPWFNDIPLHRWDALCLDVRLARPFGDAGDYATIAGLVCVAKEAARQWLEGAPKCEHTWGCVNDGKHGREELWVCRHCGEREYR